MINYVAKNCQQEKFNGISLTRKLINGYKIEFLRNTCNRFLLTWTQANIRIICANEMLYLGNIESDNLNILENNSGAQGHWTHLAFQRIWPNIRAIAENQHKHDIKRIQQIYKHFRRQPERKIILITSWSLKKQKSWETILFGSTIT